MKTLLITIGLVMLTLLAGTAGAVGSAYMYAPSVDNPTAQSGCVIRFDEKTRAGNTRPSIHANSTHYCLGVSSVSADYPSGDLVIDMQTVGPIVSIAVSPDETLVSRGIDCGASGGAGTIRVRCYDRYGKVKAYSPKMYANTANLWLGWSSWDKAA
jgi:hypothetical protein